MGLFDIFKKKKNETVEEEVNIEELTEEISEEEEELSDDVTDDEGIEENFETTEEYESEEAADDETADSEQYSEQIEEIASEEESEEIKEIEETEEIEEIGSDGSTLTEPEEQEADETTEEPKKAGFFARIKQGLAKTRENLMSGVEGVLKSFTKIDEEFYEELEEALIMADVGVETSGYIIEQLRDKVKKDKLHDTSEVKEAIVEVISEILEEDEEPFELPMPTVLLIIGVNGVGKTTTIGKLTAKYIANGKSVLLAAADTFRAAAIDQLQVWADRSDAKLIKHQENSDPGAVVFDAVKAAKARGTDILICDTAGRLHNKKNLMDELSKISKIIAREYPEAKVETLLVLDATTGQNALQQAKLFKEAADITGLVLTKLDGTAKGGIVIAIKHEMNLPVRYIGVGEAIDDLREFDSKEFSRALFEE